MNAHNCDICGDTETIIETLAPVHYGKPYTHVEACASCGDVKSAAP